MRLIYPALTTASLSLTALPSLASPMAIAISIDWARVAIAAGLVLAFIGIALFAVWIDLKMMESGSQLIGYILMGSLLILLFVQIYLLL